jgi:hypothetical protein
VPCRSSHIAKPVELCTRYNWHPGSDRVAEDDCAGINSFPLPFSVPNSVFWICESPPSLIIEHTKFTDPSYYSWLSTSLFTVFGFICPQFRDCLHEQASTSTPRSTTPQLLYNRLPRSPSFYVLSRPRAPYYHRIIRLNPLSLVYFSHFPTYSHPRHLPWPDRPF